MNRLVIIAVVLFVLVCLACIGVGALLLSIQSSPVAQVSPVPSAPLVASPAVPNSTAPAITLPTPVQTIAAPAHTENGITVSVNQFTNDFPTQLLFNLGAQSSAKITQIALFISIDGQSSSNREVPQFTANTQVQATYKWSLVQAYMPPGVTGKFWWTVQDSAGGHLETPKQSFRVDDTAHQWKKIANDQLALYWYDGDNSFGQALFDRGVQAIKFLQQDTGVTIDQQVQMYIYGSHSDLLNALSVGTQEWTGGQDFPEYGVVLIGVAPSDLDWGLGATTHELTHQVIHQKIRSPLGDLSMPHWMDEGLAVYYQTYPGTLDSQFAIPLRRAIQNNTLLSLRSLSGAFPADSSAANLAYAESYSVVNFIIQHYGRPKLAALLQGFKTGGFYDDIFKQVLGVDTDGLENQWRQDVGAPQRVIPTVVVTTPTPFPTFSLSTDATPTPAP